MIVATPDEWRGDAENDDFRVLTAWDNQRTIRRDLAGLRVAVVVQSRQRDAWLDEVKWIVSPGGINYVSGNVCYRDEWLHESKLQGKRVKVYADEHVGAIKIDRDWRGPPERGYEHLGDLDWRVGSRWRVDETGAEHVR